MTTAVSAAAPDPSSLPALDRRIVQHGHRWPDRLLRAAEVREPAVESPTLRKSTGAAGPTAAEEAVEADVASWREAVDPAGAGLFAKRLAWAGLDPERLGEWLPMASAPSAPSDAERLPEWWQELEELRAAARSATRDDAPARGRPADASDIPFADLLAPIVSWNAERLARELGTEHRRRVADAAWEGLQNALLQRLAEICAPTLGQEFSLTRTAGANLTLGLLADAGAGAPHRGRYRAWCRDQLADGFTGILGKYPVLGRLIVVVAQQWRRNTAQLLSRVARDRQLLSARLGVPAAASLVDVEAGLSDPHRGGRGVAVLSFQQLLDDGRADSAEPVWRVVYKPKDVRIEAQFQQVLALVGSWVGEAPEPLEVVPGAALAEGGGEYGYCSYVRGRPCEGGAELRRFYRNAGRLLAVLHLLGATDAHCENLIAAGPQIHLIDAETLLQPAEVDGDDGPAGAGDPLSPGQVGDPLIADSVLRVGMLPTWVLGGSPPVAYDISALGVESSGSPVVRPGWAHINTDDMVWVRVSEERSQPTSLPVTAGRPNPLADWADTLVAGFEEVYRAAMVPSHREELLGALGGFHGLRRRVVLRATRVYALVQQAALRPRALRDANARAFELERLARSSLLADGPGPLWSVFAAELVDMENLDVPYFDYRLGMDTVDSADGTIFGLIRADGLAQAVDRVGRLSERDLDWQRRIIRSAILARYQRMSSNQAPEGPSAALRRPGRPPVRSCFPLSSESARDAAHTIAVELERDAIWDGRGNRTWLTLSLLPDAERLQLGLIGDGLYDGRAGLAAFAGLLRAGAARPDGAAMFAPALQRLTGADPYARLRYLRDLGLGWGGLGGILRMIDLQRSSISTSLLSAAQEAALLTSAAELIGRDPYGDLLSGVAGLVAPVARRHRAESDQATARLLAAAADRLVSTQLDEGGWPSPIASRPLTGLAHGAAGMGLALLEAGTALGRSDYVAAAARAFAYEHRHLAADAGNWPDFRTHALGPDGEPGFMVAWCHGAAGIGLARARALDLAPDHPDAAVWRHELEVAMATVAACPLGPTDHLCCGNLGRAAILRGVGRWAGRSAWVAAADDLTRRVLDRAGTGGGVRFALPVDESASTGSVTPGLMTGVAGIGAHLVASADGADLLALLV